MLALFVSCVIGNGCKCCKGKQKEAVQMTKTEQENFSIYEEKPKADCTICYKETNLATLSDCPHSETTHALCAVCIFVLRKQKKLLCPTCKTPIQVVNGLAVDRFLALAEQRNPSVKLEKQILFAELKVTHLQNIQFNAAYWVGICICGVVGTV